jgi:hypothetical protein
MHVWEDEKKGLFTIVRRLMCHRCGSGFACNASAVPDAEARKLGIPDDCDDAVAYNIHVA